MGASMTPPTWKASEQASDVLLLCGGGGGGGVGSTALVCGTSAAAIAGDTLLFGTVRGAMDLFVVNAEKIHNSLLCTHAKLRATVAEAFAQRLWAAGVTSVKEYLSLTLEEVEQCKLQLAAVNALDASLHGVDGLPENLHYRPCVPSRLTPAQGTILLPRWSLSLL